MLLNIVNPSAEIREGYPTSILATTDGRILTGQEAKAAPTGPRASPNASVPLSCVAQPWYTSTVTG